MISSILNALIFPIVVGQNVCAKNRADMACAVGHDDLNDGLSLLQSSIQAVIKNRDSLQQDDASLHWHELRPAQHVYARATSTSGKEEARNGDKSRADSKYKAWLRANGPSKSCACSRASLVEKRNGHNITSDGTQSCGAPPMLIDKKRTVQDMIADSKGPLVIANPEMRCTVAVKAAFDAKKVAYEEYDFNTPFEYTANASPVWDWLHCKYPNDKEGQVIMHSYVFLDGKFIGQGFAAADDLLSGKHDTKLNANGAITSCEDEYPSEASIVQHYMDDEANKVLLFGWLSCPCTGIAQARLAKSSVCYKDRTWANPGSNLMKYLQCKEKTSQDHSFVYFREGGVFKHVGNGFDLDENAMSNDEFNKLVTQSGAETNCYKPNVATNVYGTPLEECRAQSSDLEGSWMDDGTCSETTGGIHQICVEALPADFSGETHQSEWSKGRAGKRHCVCVGAWSLYMTDSEKHPENAENIMPHCEAIPETALTEQYLLNWKDWNGYSASVIEGVGELVTRCLEQVGTQTHAIQLKCGLKQRFEDIEEEVAELKNAAQLDSLRSKFAELQCSTGSPKL